MLTLIFAEVSVLAAGVMVDAVTDIAPIWIWPITGGVSAILAVVIAGSGWWRPRVIRRFRHGRGPLAATPTVDMTRMEEAQKRSAQVDADFRAFLYDLNTALGRLFIPKAYRRDKSDDQDVEGPQ